MAEQIDDDSTVHGVEDNSELLKISELTVQSQTILISLYNLRVNIKNIETNFRNYERESIKFIRQLRKNQKSRGTLKKVEDKKEREPSGFAKKSKIRRELVEFLKNPEIIAITNEIVLEEDAKDDSKFQKLDDDNMINRPSTTKIINRYVKEKGLQNVTNKQFFIPDDKLKKILAPLETLDKKNGGYRYFNLQKYIKHLFV
jgi:chromatin remodeling complex protein RSC6